MSIPTTGAVLGATLLASTGIYGLAGPEIEATPAGRRVAVQAQVALATAPLPPGMAGTPPVPAAPVQKLIELKVIEQKMMGQPMPAPAAMPQGAQPMMQPRMPMANAAPTAPVSTQVHGFDGIIASERQLLQRTSSTAAYEAHIASVGNMPEAEKLWQDISSRLGGSFNGVSAHFKVIDVPQHGSFVRLMAGDFADASRTADFCRAVIATGRDCRILRKLSPSG